MSSPTVKFNEVLSLQNMQIYTYVSSNLSQIKWKPKILSTVLNFKAPFTYDVTAKVLGYVISVKCSHFTSDKIAIESDALYV